MKPIYILEGEYEDAVARQAGRCAICGALGPLVRDHCHVTGRFRELLCASCNTAEGFLKSNPETALAMALYIEKWHNTLRKFRLKIHREAMAARYSRQGDPG